MSKKNDKQSLTEKYVIHEKSDSHEASKTNQEVIFGDETVSFEDEAIGNLYRDEEFEITLPSLSDLGSATNGRNGRR